DSCVSLRPGALPEWNIDLRIVAAEPPLVTNVIEDPHDLPFEGRAQLCFAWDQFLNHDSLRERIDAGKMAIDKVLIDHGHAGGARDVLLGEATPFDYTHSESFEVFGSHHLKASARARGRIDRRAAHNGEGHAEAGASQRKADRSRRHLDTGHSLDLLKQLAIVGDDLLRIGKAGRRHRQGKCERVLDANAKTPARKIPKTSQSQSSSRQ